MVLPAHAGGPVSRDPVDLRFHHVAVLVIHHSAIGNLDGSGVGDRDTVMIVQRLAAARQRQACRPALGEGKGKAAAVGESRVLQRGRNGEINRAVRRRFLRHGRNDDASVFPDRNAFDRGLHVPAHRSADAVARAVGDKSRKRLADKILFPAAGYGKGRIVRRCKLEFGGLRLGKAGDNALVRRDAADRVAAVGRRDLDAVDRERGELIAVVGNGRDHGAAAAAHRLRRNADAAVFIAGLRADREAGQAQLGDRGVGVDIIQVPLVRGVNLRVERKGFLFRQSLRSRFGREKAVLVLFAQTVDRADDALCLRVNAVRKAEKALFGAAGANFNRDVRRNGAQEGCGTVFRLDQRGGRIEDDRPVAQARAGDEDRAGSAGQIQAHLRLDTDEIRRAGGVDGNGAAAGIGKRERAVAGKSDAAAPTHRVRADGRQGAAARQADLEVGAHHRQHQHGSGSVIIGQRQGVAQRVITHALGQKIARFGLLIRVKDFFFDGAVGGIDGLLFSAHQADRRVHAVRRAGAVRRKGAGREQADKRYQTKQKANAFFHFHVGSSEHRVFYRRRGLLSARPLRHPGSARDAVFP